MASLAATSAKRLADDQAVATVTRAGLPRRPGSPAPPLRRGSRRRARAGGRLDLPRAGRDQGTRRRSESDERHGTDEAGLRRNALAARQIYGGRAVPSCAVSAVSPGHSAHTQCFRPRDESRLAPLEPDMDVVVVVRQRERRPPGEQRDDLQWHDFCRRNRISRTARSVIRRAPDGLDRDAAGPETSSVAGNVREITPAEHRAGGREISDDTVT